MKKWKKYISFLLALVLCLSLAACKGDDADAGSDEILAAGIPDTIENLVLDTSVKHDYSDYLGTWLDEKGSVLTVEAYNGGRVCFQLSDANGNLTASGPLQYVEEYRSVYAHNDYDGIAYLTWISADEVYIESLGTFTKVSGDVPGETIGDTGDEALTDISGFVGYWKVVDEPYYYIINDAYEWAAIDLYGEEIGPGYVEVGEDHITLCAEDGSEVISLWQTDVYELTDEYGNTLWGVDDMMLLPTPEDELSEIAYFSDGFENVSINYPMQMIAYPVEDVRNSVSFDAFMADSTDDYYSNILIAFQSISGYDSYMEKGAATAESYMEKMLDEFMDSMYGDYLIKSDSSDFKDNGDYYSITGNMWLDSSIFDGYDLTQPVRGYMEVRYYGPTSYALVAVTIAPENRIENYHDICKNMLKTISYSNDWSTSSTDRPEQSGDSGNDETPYYWYDEDGDIWYWNGHENVFICFGDDGYIEDGEYFESNDAGWDTDDYYGDDYDPWSDPGDGGYGQGDYFD